MADVIATTGWCELAVVIASGRWNSHRVFLFYFSLSSDMLTRTSSHTCGRWYLPTFLFRDVGREDLNQMRTIKEAIYIRVNDPSLNRNVGKYHLPHVWDEVLVNISELKLK